MRVWIADIGVLFKSFRAGITNLQNTNPSGSVPIHQIKGILSTEDKHLDSLQEVVKSKVHDLSHFIFSGEPLKTHTCMYVLHTTNLHNTHNAALFIPEAHHRAWLVLLLSREWHYPNPLFKSPMLLTNIHGVDIHPILEPPLLVRELDIVPAHLPFPHEAIVGEGPVLQPICPPPLTGLVVPFVPELYCNL